MSTGVLISLVLLSVMAPFAVVKGIGIPEGLQLNYMAGPVFGMDRQVVTFSWVCVIYWCGVHQQQSL